jgi:hypothetical protein
LLPLELLHQPHSGLLVKAWTGSTSHHSRVYEWQEIRLQVSL